MLSELRSALGLDAARERILRGELPPVADDDVREALAILKRTTWPPGQFSVRLADGRKQSADLVLATAMIPRAQRAACERRWHDRSARFARRQRASYRAIGSTQALAAAKCLSTFARAHASAASAPIVRATGARPRGAGRPRARRTSSSSRTSGTDPGGSGKNSDDGPPPPPRLRLWRHPRYGPVNPAMLRVLLASRRREAVR